jgi:DNA-binding MarR family transcriptional regulator
MDGSEARPLRKQDEERHGWPTKVCNCLNLRRASSAITKIYDEKLAPSGLTISQYSILRHLKSFGPVTVSELALKIKLDRTTLVRSLKPLEAAFLVADVSQKHTRGRRLQLTPEGLAKCAEAKSMWIDAQELTVREIGRENIEKLTALLSLVEGLGS